MKGSNLAVGLSTNTVPTHEIPPAFFRTLAHIFESAKLGIPYTPVTPESLMSGAPQPGWCPPLWGHVTSGPGDVTTSRKADMASQTRVRMSKKKHGLPGVFAVDALT